MRWIDEPDMPNLGRRQFFRRMIPLTQWLDYDPWNKPALTVFGWFYREWVAGRERTGR